LRRCRWHIGLVSGRRSPTADRRALDPGHRQHNQARDEHGAPVVSAERRVGLPFRPTVGDHERAAVISRARPYWAYRACRSPDRRRRCARPLRIDSQRQRESARSRRLRPAKRAGDDRLGSVITGPWRQTAMRIGWTFIRLRLGHVRPEDIVLWPSSDD